MAEKRFSTEGLAKVRDNSMCLSNGRKVPGVAEEIHASKVWKDKKLERSQHPDLSGKKRFGFYFR